MKTPLWKSEVEREIVYPSVEMRCKQLGFSSEMHGAKAEPVQPF
jgi:hypothetical protein